MREKAGTPTYRALAKTAGFSATTLSEAAAGVRRPSLDVTLAYVGACGGDVEAWQRRWTDLDTELAATPGVAIPGTATDAVPGTPTGTAADAARGAATGTAADAACGAASDVAPGTALGSAPAADAASGTAADADSGVDTAAVRGTAAAGRGGATDVARGIGVAGSRGVDVDVTLRPGTPERRGRYHRLRRRTSRAVTWIAAGCAALAVSATMIWSMGEATVTATAVTSASGCPTFPAPGAFQGTTYAATRVRTGASQDQPVKFSVPPGCTLQFTGYCIGGVITGQAAGPADSRWFKLAGGGVVSSSAIAHVDPPAGMRSSSCPHDVPAPTAITLTAARSGADAIRLAATGTRAEIVGYAAFYSDAPGPTADPTWHQISLTDSARTAFATTWRAGGSLIPPQGGVKVAAVACLGGGDPTDVIDARVISADPTAVGPVALSAVQRVAAERTACQEPATG